MDKPVIMVAGVLKEIGIDNAQGNTPLLVRHVGVDVPCSYDVENGEQEYSHKSRHRHPVFHQVGKERYEQEYGSRMLQELLMWIHRLYEGDSREAKNAMMRMSLVLFILPQFINFREHHGNTPGMV